MRVDDATKRVRNAILSTLDEFGITGTDVRKNNTPAVSFTFAGQTRIVSYKGGDVRAHRNAKTRMRRLLRTVGARPVGVPETTSLDEGLEEMIFDQPSPVDTTGSSNDDTESTVELETLDDELEVNQPAGPNEAPLHNGDGYMVFHPTKYRSPQFELSRRRFIAVELEEDLIVSKGSLLIVPLDLKNQVWPMSASEFRLYFQPVRIPAQRQSPAAADPQSPVSTRSTPAAASVPDHPAAQIVPETVEDRVAEDLVSEQPVVEEQPIVQPPIPAPAAVSEPSDQPEITEQPPVDDEDEASEPVAAFPQPKSERPSWPKISPQMGRVLLAMYFLYGNNQQEVITPDVARLLSPVDAKQLSGMLSGLIRSRFVERGTSTSSARPTFAITEAGIEAAQTIGTWPYDHRRMARPEWLVVDEEEQNAQ